MSASNAVMSISSSAVGENSAAARRIKLSMRFKPPLYSRIQRAVNAMTGIAVLN